MLKNLKRIRSIKNILYRNVRVLTTIICLIAFCSNSFGVPTAYAVNNIVGGISPGTGGETWFEYLSSGEQTAWINTMVADHVQWLRLDTPGDLAGWYNVEIADAEAAGINVDAIIETWGMSSVTPATMGTMCSEQVAQLQPLGVETYEVINEPNLNGFSASTYESLLQPCYTAIKAADSSATVLLGGLAPDSDYDTNDNYTGDSAATYLQTIYTDGGGSYFDAANMHPYVYDTNLDQTAMTPADCPANAWNPWVSCPYDLNDGQQDELVAIRTVMDNNGDSAKAIWLTEFGCPTANPAICDDSTLSTQITDTYEQANANPGNEYGLLGPMLFYSWTDADATNDPSGTGYDNYGLYTDAGTPKTLSLTAFLNSTPVGSVSSPEVTINSPSSNAYAHGNSATADVTLTDNDGGSVVNGQLYLNGSLLSTLTSSPYDFSYSTLGLSDGTYPVQIDSSDSLSQSNSGSVNVIVNNGDLNDDGSVDISDLAIMAANWGSTTASYAQGSILSDGNVDISDLAIMASNWGWSA